MKNATIGIILLFLISIFGITYSVSGEAASEAIYSTYLPEKDQWTNFTIFPQGYRVSSDMAIYNDLEGDFQFSPWDLIVSKMNEVSFFALNLTDSNPTTILQIDYLDDSNTISLSNNSVTVEVLIGLVENISSRLVGAYNEVAYWGVDLSVIVLESYPEQYGVSALVQRGNDMLAIVYEKNATLIVADYDIYAKYLDGLNGNISYTAEKSFILNSGGQTDVINFDTFSVGTDYKPADLYFFVVFENGIYLKLFSQDGLPNIGYSSMNISNFKVSDKDTIDDLDKEGSRGLKLSFGYFWFILPLILIPRVLKWNIIAKQNN